MDAGFSKDVYRGYMVKGDLLGAIDYVGRFPEQAELYERYKAVFEREQYVTYDVAAELNEILMVYQRYYRDIFYLKVDKKSAEDRLRAGLAGCLGIDGGSVELCDIEQDQVAGAFRRRGFHFMGGRTSGYHGPYIWRTTERKTYDVELPDAVQGYTVDLLDGFIARSWMDYISFGEVGTGGWSNGDGIINCVKSVYDLDGEDFQVSLLKHEAQHDRDLAMDEGMSSADLEYRAKLVELIYSSERDMLGRFAREADGADESNGHASASGRIVEGFARKLGLSRAQLEGVPKETVQAAARSLFQESGGRPASPPCRG